MTDSVLHDAYTQFALIIYPPQFFGIQAQTIGGPGSYLVDAPAALPTASPCHRPLKEVEDYPGVLCYNRGTLS